MEHEDVGNRFMFLINVVLLHFLSVNPSKGKNLLRVF